MINLKGKLVPTGDMPQYIEQKLIDRTNKCLDTQKFCGLGEYKLNFFSTNVGIDGESIIFVFIPRNQAILSVKEKVLVFQKIVLAMERDVSLIDKVGNFGRFTWMDMKNDDCELRLCDSGDAVKNFF